MDWLSFIAAMTKAFAWLVAAVALVMLLRRPLADVLPLLKHVKYGDFEIDFEREIRVIEKLADRALPKTEEVETKRSLGFQEPDRETIIQLASVAPAAAVVVAWSEVERALIAAAEQNNIIKADYPVSRNTAYITRILASQNKIDRLTLTICSELQRLRNAVTHGLEQITTAEAVEFSDLAARFVAKLAKA